MLRQNSAQIQHSSSFRSSSTFVYKRIPSIHVLPEEDVSSRPMKNVPEVHQKKRPSRPPPTRPSTRPPPPPPSTRPIAPPSAGNAAPVSSNGEAIGSLSGNKTKSRNKVYILKLATKIIAVAYLEKINVTA